MKKGTLKLVSILSGLILFFLLSSCTEQASTGPVDLSDDSSISDDFQLLVNDIAITDLTDSEMQKLLFMREEEKLARDVYRYLYLKWHQNTFNNISKSEDRHSGSILYLINRYKLSDPVKNNADGVFTNQDLQLLYNDLIEAGSVSLVEALKSGAAIEEIDIIDLDEAIAATDNNDIKLVYSNLRKGSENHLNSFVKILARNGVVYVPQFLSIEMYNEIIR